MYIQAFLQKNCDPFRNSPSGSLAHSLLPSILHKRRGEKKVWAPMRFTTQHTTFVACRKSRVLSSGVGPPSRTRRPRCEQGTQSNNGAIWLRTHIHLWDGCKTRWKMEKKICLCNGGDEKWRTYCSLRYCSNKLNSQHLQMNKLQKYFPLMLNEL